MEIVQCYVSAWVFTCLVLLHALYGFVENVIVVRIKTKIGNRARCGGRVVCIGRKVFIIIVMSILYAHILSTW